MTLRHLKILVAVCQTNSITKAAEKLYMSQPSVSIAIKDLEEYYDQPIFERYYRRLKITPFGRELFLYAQRIVALVEEMDIMANTSLTDNRIRIGVGTTVGQVMVPEIVRNFIDTHEGADISVTIEKVSLLKQALMENRIDFAVAESLSEDPSIKILATINTPLVAVCHKDNPLSQKQNISAGELAKEVILARQPGSYTRTAVDKYFEAHDIHIQPKWESIDGLALLNAVRQNLGISFLALNHVMSLNAPELAIMQVEDFDVNYHYSIFTHRDKIMTPFMMELVNAFTESQQA